VIAVVLGLARRREEEDAVAEEETKHASDTWTPPPPLELADGTTAEVKQAGRALEVHDKDARLLWAYEVEPDETSFLRRAIPFGPFIALAALEFLFFGDRLVEAYLALVL
jgi:hypothetical protein